MSVTGAVVRILVSILAAVLAWQLMLHAWGGWVEPPCVGPQTKVVVCGQ